MYRIISNPDEHAQEGPPIDALQFLRELSSGISIEAIDEYRAQKNVVIFKTDFEKTYGYVD